MLRVLVVVRVPALLSRQIARSCVRSGHQCFERGHIKHINIVTDDKYFEKVDKDQNLSYLHDYKFTLIAKTPAGLELLIWVCV